MDQFNKVLGAVQSSPELVALGTDGRGQERFTSREMIAVEERLHQASQNLAQRELHKVSERGRDAALARSEARGLTLSSEQHGALSHITEGRDLSVVVGYPHPLCPELGRRHTRGPIFLQALAMSPKGSTFPSNLLRRWNGTSVG